MRISRLLVVPALVAAMFSMAGCGAGDLKIGQSAVVSLGKSGDPKSTYEVTVKSLVEAPAEVMAQYESTDKVYFVMIDAKLTEPTKATGPIAGVNSNVYAKLSDGNYLDTWGSGPDECTGSFEVPSQASADFLAGKTVTVCVPLSAKGDKDVVGVYVGTADVNSGTGKVWAKS